MGFPSWYSQVKAPCPILLKPVLLKLPQYEIWQYRKNPTLLSISYPTFNPAEKNFVTTFKRYTESDHYSPSPMLPPWSKPPSCFTWLLYHLSTLLPPFTLHFQRSTQSTLVKNVHRMMFPQSLTLTSQITKNKSTVSQPPAPPFQTSSLAILLPVHSASDTAMASLTFLKPARKSPALGLYTCWFSSPDG